MPRFTPGELKVMRLLWEHGEMKPADLQKAGFPEPIKNPAAPLLSDNTPRERTRHAAACRQGILLQACHAVPICLSVHARRASGRRRNCGGSVQSLVMKHHPVGEAERGRAALLLRCLRGRRRFHGTTSREAEPKMSLLVTALEFFAGVPDDSIGPVLIVKWTAVLALAWLAWAACLVGRNPRWRVALWRSSIVGLAMVAALSVAPPIVTYQSVARDSPSVGVA